ncbi:hypothetical protein Forpe1208_v011474 [Fusarium oxysporum f. sp. rapae]|uniref:Protein kinase domain-containing protein n=1 Tax=Fusarium oxysporum f. sp. rapae TaxID=485398 RepID=A0A8J5NW83_FUSOX|nr:hypothetical protein Forpe1208_v011474 [Fusarium oxysporum f. sp. rapae]
MAEAVGTILGVLGLVGTAIDVLKLGYIALDRRDTVTILRGQLYLEGVLLRRWAECVLIGPHGEVRIISMEYCRIIHERLTTMLKPVQDASELVIKHSKDLAPLFPPGQTEAAAEQVPTRRFTRLFQVLSKAKITSSPFKWAVRDAETLKELLGHIQATRGQLAELLPPDIQLMSLQVLADVMPSTSIGSVSTIDTAARATTENHMADAGALDTLRATIAIRDLCPDTIPTLEEANARVQNLYIKNFSLIVPEFLPAGTERCSVLMSSQQISSNPRPVVIEWRQFNKELYDDVVLFEADVVKLCWLLHSLRSHPDLHLPRCLGFIKESNYVSTRFGLVLDFPSTIHRAPSTCLVGHESLHAAMQNIKYRMPPIEIRLHFAMSIAASVFQLLSAGWLHKALRSENILLAHGLDIPSLESENLEQLNAVDFIIAGFEFSRLDKPGQVSGDGNPKEQDLYRHPNAVSEKRATPEYQQRGYIKAYDIYALGVLLAELGFWRTMGALKKSQGNREDWKDKPFSQYLRSRVDSDMAGMVGSRFAKVVLWCLDTETTGATSWGDSEFLQQFEENVLVNLAQCRQAAIYL